MPGLIDCIKKLKSLSPDVRDRLMNRRAELIGQGMSPYVADTTTLLEWHKDIIGEYNEIREDVGLEKIDQSPEIQDYQNKITQMPSGIQDQIIGLNGANRRNFDERSPESRKIMSDLDDAMRLKRVGIPELVIKRLTGWEEENGKWYFEGNDVQIKDVSKLYDLLIEGDSDMMLSDVFDITEFASYYPDINKTKLKFIADENKDWEGEYLPTENKITINSAKFKKWVNTPNFLFGKPTKEKTIKGTKGLQGVLKLLNHELAHIVQEAEGMPEGGVPSQALADWYNKNLPKEEHLTPMEVYTRLYGEAQARAVMDRVGMTEEERRNSLLKLQDSVAPQDRILLTADTIIGSQQSIQGIDQGNSEIYLENLDSNDINSLRASLRKKAPDSDTLNILDELQKATKDDVSNVSDTALEFLDKGITLGNVKNMLIEEEIFESGKDVDNYFMQIGGQNSMGVFKRLNGLKSPSTEKPTSKKVTNSEDLHRNFGDREWVNDVDEFTNTDLHVSGDSYAMVDRLTNGVVKTNDNEFANQFTPNLDAGIQDQEIGSNTTAWPRFTTRLVGDSRFENDVTNEQIEAISNRADAKDLILQANAAVEAKFAELKDKDTFGIVDGFIDYAIELLERKEGEHGALWMFKRLMVSRQIKTLLQEDYDGKEVHQDFADTLLHEISKSFTLAGQTLMTANDIYNEFAEKELGFSYDMLPPNVVKNLNRPHPNGGLKEDGTPRTTKEEIEHVSEEARKLMEQMYEDKFKGIINGLMDEMERLKNEVGQLKEEAKPKPDTPESGQSGSKPKPDTSAIDAILARLNKPIPQKKSDKTKASRIETDAKARVHAIKGYGLFKEYLKDPSVGFAYDPGKIDPRLEQAFKEFWKAAVEAAKGRLLRAKEELEKLFEKTPELYNFAIPSEIWETYNSTDDGKQFVGDVRKTWAVEKLKEVTKEKGPTDPRDHFDELFGRMRASKRPEVQKMLRTFASDIESLGNAMTINDTHLQLLREAIVFMQDERNALNLDESPEAMQRYAEVEEKIDELLDFVEFLSGSRDIDQDVRALDFSTQMRRKRRAALSKGLATLGTTVDQIIKDWFKYGSVKQSLAQQLAAFVPVDIALRIEAALMAELDEMMKESRASNTEKENRALIESIQKKKEKLKEFDDKSKRIKELEDIIESEYSTAYDKDSAKRELDVLLGISTQAESDILASNMTEFEKKQALDELNRTRNLNKKERTLEDTARRIQDLEALPSRTVEEESELEFQKELYDMLSKNKSLEDAKDALQKMISANTEELVKLRKIRDLKEDIDSINKTGSPKEKPARNKKPVDPRIAQLQAEKKAAILRETLRKLKDGSYKTKERTTTAESAEIESLKEQIKEERKRISGLKSALASITKAWDPVQIIKALKAGAMRDPAAFLAAIQSGTGSTVTPKQMRMFTHLSGLVQHIHKQPNGSLYNGIAMQKALAILRNLRSQMAARPLQKSVYAILNSMFTNMLSHPMSAINSLYGSLQGHLEIAVELIVRFSNGKDTKMAMRMLMRRIPAFMDAIALAYGQVFGGRNFMALTDQENAMMSRDMFDRISDDTWRNLLAEMVSGGVGAKGKAAAKMAFKLMRQPLKKAMDIFQATDIYTSHLLRTWNEEWDAYDKLKPQSNNFGDLIAMIHDELGVKEYIIRLANQEARMLGYSGIRKREYVVKRTRELREAHITDFVLVEHAEHAARKSILINNPEGWMAARFYKGFRGIDSNEEDLDVLNAALSLLKNMFLPFGRNLANFTQKNVSQMVAYTTVLSPLIPNKYKNLRALLTPHYNSFKDSQESLKEYWDVLEKWKREINPDERRALEKQLKKMQVGSVTVFKGGKLDKEIYNKRDLLKAFIGTVMLGAMGTAFLKFFFDDEENEMGKMVKKPKNIRHTGTGTGLTYADRQAKNYEPNAIQIKDENGNWRTLAKWPFLVQHPIFFYIGHKTDEYYSNNYQYGSEGLIPESVMWYALATAPIQQNSQAGITMFIELLSRINPDDKSAMYGMDPFIKFATNVTKQLFVPGAYVHMQQMKDYVTNDDIKVSENPYYNTLAKNILFNELADKVAYGPLGEAFKQEFPLRMYEWVTNPHELTDYQDPELQQLKKALKDINVEGIFKYAYVSDQIGDKESGNILISGLPKEQQEEIRRLTAVNYGQSVIANSYTIIEAIRNMQTSDKRSAVRAEIEKIFIKYFDESKEKAENEVLSAFLLKFMDDLPEIPESYSVGTGLQGGGDVREILSKYGFRFLNGEWIVIKTQMEQMDQHKIEPELIK